jgi:hypothetical protein
MHAAFWKGRGNHRVSKNFQNLPGGRGGAHVEGSFTPETFGLVE